MTNEVSQKSIKKFYANYTTYGLISTLKKIVFYLGHNILLFSLPYSRTGDKLYSYISFVLIFHRLPNKQLFSDFLFKIKTSDEILNPLRTFVTDKELLKLYVRAQVGDKYNVPTIGVLSSYSELHKFEFPDTCCIKPTHASGFVIFKKTGQYINKESLCHWFELNYYRYGREANYKYLNPKIIIEPIVFNDDNNLDYKFFCYRGVVKLVQVDIDRHSNHTRDFYDTEWQRLNFSLLYPNSKKLVPKPANFVEMLSIASKLSEPFTLIRVDLYSDGSSVFVGELTNIHGNISEVFSPRSSEIEFSKLLFT